MYLENAYDTAGKVIRQTQGDGGEYAFDYTVNGSGQITQTDVTNPRGYVRRLAFNSAGYVTSDTEALGETIEQVTTYTRLSGSHLVETVTDELGRATRFEYDTKGHPTGVARLYGTADEQVTTFTYHPTYNLVTSVTDPLLHTTTYTYDSQRRLVSITDPLTHQTTFAWNAAGQPVSTTTALNKTTTFTYDVGDLVQVTTPLVDGKDLWWHFDHPAIVDDLVEKLSARVLPFLTSMHSIDAMVQFLTSTEAKRKYPDPWSIIYLAILKSEQGDNVGACALLAEFSRKAGQAWESRIGEVSARLGCSEAIL